MAFLKLSNLQVAYEKNKPILKDYNLEVERGALVSLLGPSGCGKTTTLRSVAGFIAPERGAILVGGKDYARLPPHKRNIGLVFQNYALFPHLSVFDNVAFGLKMRRVSRQETQERVPAALEKVGMKGFEDRLPSQLSGGQQQRVALARAIVIEPDLLLLDEPLSNLDAKLRIEMRGELRRLQKDLGITMLYVTHDQAEALSLSDRIVVMNNGDIEQDDVPEVVYHQPGTAFVAGFMGFDNRFEARISAKDADGLTITAGEHSLQAAPADLPAGAHVHAFFRPNTARLETAPGPNRIAGQYDFHTFQGNTTQYFINTTLGRFTAVLPEERPRTDLGDVYLHIPPESLVVTPRD
ncbi:MAG: ABC transporter ATP-binding protein [Anaerolineae bacterium]|nr:ABC transporter ATP-binding protein [Anaerolineae bacterium]